MPTPLTKDELDAVEYLIATTVENDPVMQQLWLYFHWQTEPDGVPYLNIMDLSGRTQTRTLPAKPGGNHHAQGHLFKRFDLFCVDRDLLREMEKAISAAFDTKRPGALKDGCFCNSIVQELPWRRTFDNTKTELFDNIWHSQTRIVFNVEHFSGSV